MRDTLLDELSVRHIIWNITVSTDLYLYIVIYLCLCELPIVSVYIWYLSNFDCELKFLLSINVYKLYELFVVYPLSAELISPTDKWWQNPRFKK